MYGTISWCIVLIWLPDWLKMKVVHDQNVYDVEIYV